MPTLNVGVRFRVVQKTYSFLTRQILVTAILLAANTAIAAEGPTDQVSSFDEIQSSSQPSDTMDQVTSVSQLRDVQPTDWAFQALQSLVERYGCIAGYPDGTYRGNKPMSRYEFAAGLNACMEKVNQLISSSTSSVTKNDLTVLQKLQEQFATELASLRGRVDSLESRTAELEAHQFSSTTKLHAEAIFAIEDVFGDRQVRSSGQAKAPLNSVQDNVIESNRLRLNFDSSFTGQDLLRTRLQARNTVQYDNAISGTRMTRLNFDGNNQNQFTLDRLFYIFPVSKTTKVTIDAVNADFTDDNVYAFNPLFTPTGTGSLSRFGRFNPIYRQTGPATTNGISTGGAGLTIVQKLSKQADLSLAYQGFSSNDPSQKAGLFNGAYVVLAQLGLKPVNNLDLGFTYTHNYYPGASVNMTASTGSDYATQPFGNVATSGDNFGIEASFRPLPKFVISGWGEYTQATAESNVFLKKGTLSARTIKSGDTADIVNWALTLGFTDFGKKGNLLGFIFGMPPKVTSTPLRGQNVYAGNTLLGTKPFRNDSKATSYHIEAFYRYQVSDNISITPGAFLIIDPNDNNANGNIWVGTLRTVFTF